jgi:drug/metabolite transporter (DMT)-like permease
MANMGAEPTSPSKELPPHRHDNLRPKAKMVAFVLGGLYLCWGSWFMFSSLAVRTIPPWLGVGSRNIISALVLLLPIILITRASLRITKKQLIACIIGGMVVEAFAPLVTAAEKDVPSALAAVLGSGYPILVLVLRKFLRESIPLAAFVAGGIGMLGVAVLLLPGGQLETTSASGLLLVLLGVICWSVSAVLLARMDMPKNAFVSTFHIFWITGIFMLIVGFLLGEGGQFHIDQVSTASWAGYLAIMFFGNLGLVAYVWLLARVNITVVTTEGYITPVIGVILGVVILGDPFSAIAAVGAAITISAVAYIITTEARAKKAVIIEPGGEAFTTPEPKPADPGLEAEAA